MALVAECNQRLGLRLLTDQYLPGLGSTCGDAPSVFVDSLLLRRHAGGQTLKGVRELEREIAFLVALFGETDCA